MFMRSLAQVGNLYPDRIIGDTYLEDKRLVEIAN